MPRTTPSLHKTICRIGIRLFTGTLLGTPVCGPIRRRAEQDYAAQCCSTSSPCARPKPTEIIDEGFIRQYPLASADPLALTAVVPLQGPACTNLQPACSEVSNGQRASRQGTTARWILLQHGHICSCAPRWSKSCGLGTVIDQLQMRCGCCLTFSRERGAAQLALGNSEADCAFTKGRVSGCDYTQSHPKVVISSLNRGCSCTAL